MVSFPSVSSRTCQCPECDSDLLLEPVIDVADDVSVNTEPHQTEPEIRSLFRIRLDGALNAYFVRVAEL